MKLNVKLSVSRIQGDRRPLQADERAEEGAGQGGEEGREREERADPEGVWLLHHRR